MKGLKKWASADCLLLPFPFTERLTLPQVALPFETVTVYLPFSVREDSLMGGVDERAVRLKSLRPVFMACLHSSISRIPRAAVRVET